MPKRICKQNYYIKSKMFDKCCHCCCAVTPVGSFRMCDLVTTLDYKMDLAKIIHV